MNQVGSCFVAGKTWSMVTSRPGAAGTGISIFGYLRSGTSELGLQLRSPPDLPEMYVVVSYCRGYLTLPSSSFLVEDLGFHLSHLQDPSVSTPPPIPMPIPQAWVEQ